MQQRRNNNKKKSKKPLIWIGAIVALGAIYAGGAYHYSSAKTFMPNTTIEGVNVAGKNSEQAQSLISQHIKNQTINLTDNDKVISKVKLADAGYTSTSSQSIAKAIENQNALMWPLQLINVANADSSVVVKPDKDSNAKLTAYAKKTATKLNRTRDAGTPATVSVSNGKVNVTDGKKGNTINATLLAEEIKSSVAEGKRDVNLSNTYQSTSNSSDVNKIKNQVKALSTEKAVYNVNGNTVTIPNATITSWIIIDKNADGTQKVNLDQTKLTAYLNSLNDKYASYQSDVTFNSTKQGSQTVKGGTFGWSIVTATDATKLTNNILAGKDFTEKATISGSGTSLKKGQLGNTYVEVDKTNQHMWYYENGKLVISTDVVTGKPSNGNTTPTGVYFVWNKQRNTTLKGSNDDGSAYASPVDYWMPIDYTGVGLHDSPWQPQYGGTWYKTHGSHGCVNTPPATMKKLYDAVATGTPVIVF